jgi:hypothetical protein
LKENNSKEALLDELRNLFNADDGTAHSPSAPIHVKHRMRSICAAFFRRTRMNRSIYYVFLAFAFSMFAPGLFGQTYAHKSFSDHVNLGIYGEYFQMNQTSINLAGVGGRLSVNVTPHLQLEGEFGYDFSRVFTEQFSSGGSVGFARTGMRKIDGLFGPKLMTNKGPVRLFVTAKGGAVAFGFDSRPVTFDTFASSVGDLRANNLTAVFYPGGGAEAFWGPIGLRVDIGDEIYFANHAHNNLRVTFGPTIRF